MNLLNHWLGKLNKLQLLGHGRKPLYVEHNGQRYEIAHVNYREADVIIYTAEKG